MSERDVRRPRRIIAGPDLPVPPPAQAVAPQQSERFQRALSRRPEPRGADVRGVAPPASRLPAQAPAPASASPTSAALAQPAASGRQGVQTAVQAVKGFIASALAPAMPEMQQPSGEQAAHVQGVRSGQGGAFGGAAGEGWDSNLVRMIATLCRRTDPAFEAWSVTVPLDPRVLPETELLLSLSRHRLSLRFHTQSSHSLRVLSRHRGVLLEMIQQALPGMRDIDIETT